MNDDFGFTSFDAITSSNDDFGFTSFDAKPSEEEKVESWGKDFMRNVFQIPIGFAEGSISGILSNLFNLISTGEALDPEGIEGFKRAAEKSGLPFDEEAYKSAVNQISEYFPTPGNLARMGEEKLGLPLEAKTIPQQLLRLGSSAYKMQPGTTSQKATSAITTPLIKQGLEEIGVPRPISELIGLMGGQLTGSKVPKLDINIGKKTKPSGLTERGFESLNEKTKVSEKKLNQINEKIEKDFKEISDKIINESPVGETFENLKNNKAFKEESRELLSQAQEIADTITNKVSSKDIKKSIVDKAKKEIKGYANSEYDTNFNNHIKNELKNIPEGEVSASQLVEQYRKNNERLSEYFEPGASKASNRAKRDAILSHNRSIADILEKSFPESNLSEVFKEGNSRWTKIMDAEIIDSLINDIFDGKINYKKVDKYFDDNNYSRIFKRSLGEKGYKDFTQLMKDLGESENAYKMLKIAEKKGFTELANIGLSFIIHPTFGKVKFALDTTKKAFKMTTNALLDKPKLAINWKKGIEALKKGDFEVAQKEFEILKNQTEI